MAPLQLKRFKVGSKMAIVASAPVLQNQKKTSVAKSTDSLVDPVYRVVEIQLHTVTFRLPVQPAKSYRSHLENNALKSDKWL
jgi:hypothetical protein